MRVTARVLTAALAVCLLVGCTPRQPAPTGTTSSAPALVSQAQLEAVGVVVVGDEGEVSGAPAALTFTELQVRRLLAEAEAGAGVVGRDLDVLAPVPAGLPPASYLLASYVTAAELPGAKIAAGLFEEGTDWTRAPDVVFPTAVVALFVADMVAAAAHDDSFVAEPEAQSTDPLPADGTSTSIVLVSSNAGVASGPCSAVTGFLSATIQGLFDALRVLPGVVGAIDELGFFGKILSALINGALNLAQGAVEGLISAITAPVFAAMRFAIGGLGVAAVALSFFSNERLVVHPSPSNHMTFGIEPAPGNRGSFRATGISLTKDWPATLVDCARASGVALPELLKQGDLASWTLTAGPLLLALDASDSTVDADKATTMEFTTGRENAETAKGPEVTQAARAAVTIPRREVTAFLDLAASQLDAVKADILANIPGVLHGAANAVFAATLDPVVADIRRSVADAVGGVLSLKGEGSVFVTFHRPPDPEPTPTPTPDPPVDPTQEFCAQFNAQVDIAIASLQQTSDVFAWAGAFAAGLHSITAVPPPALAADFATTLGFYDIAGVSDFSDAQALADYVEGHDVDGARNRLWAACGSNTLPEL